MRNSHTRLFLDRLVTLANEHHFEDAARQWREKQQTSGFCAQACPYGDAPALERCALCLEGRLRAVSLIAHTDQAALCAYQAAANAIHRWLSGAQDMRETFVPATP